MEQKRYYSFLNYSLVQVIQSFSVTLFLCSIYFWTKERFHFNNLHNLLLNALQGFVYIGCSTYGGKLSDRIGYNRQLRICILVEASILMVGWIPHLFYTPYLIMIGYIVFTASFWPALEAVIMHIPTSMNMPERIGSYNLNWAISGAIGFFFSGALFHWHRDAILWVPAFLHLVALFFLFFPIGWAPIGERGAMEIPHSGDEIPGDRKQFFLHAAWLGNCLGYMMYASFTALAPAVGAKFRLSPSLAIWLACTLFFSRAFSFYLFRRWQGWHYKVGWTFAAALALPSSMVLVFFSPALWMVLAGLFCFGIANGLSYYGSLYYSLDYGDNKGEHGGLHEAVIGIGLLCGPLSGALGAWLWSEQYGAQAACIIFAYLALLFGTILLYHFHPKKIRLGPALPS